MNSQRERRNRFLGSEAEKRFTEFSSHVRTRMRSAFFVYRVSLDTIGWSASSLLFASHFKPYSLCYSPWDIGPTAAQAAPRRLPLRHSSFSYVEGVCMSVSMYVCNFPSLVALLHTLSSSF